MGSYSIFSNLIFHCILYPVESTDWHSHLKNSKIWAHIIAISKAAPHQQNFFCKAYPRSVHARQLSPTHHMPRGMMKPPLSCTPRICWNWMPGCGPLFSFLLGVVIIFVFGPLFVLLLRKLHIHPYMFKWALSSRASSVLRPFIYPFHIPTDTFSIGN